MLVLVDDELTRLLQHDAVDAAPRLLGCIFGTRINGVGTAVRLTEVEAYMGSDDPASHAYRGMTPRTVPMFDVAGTIYVYLSHGIHHCINIVTGASGNGQAVLLRGGTPVEGLDEIQRRRGRSDHLADGPGKLGQALGLTTAHSGLHLDDDAVYLLPGARPERILATPRIGISKATERPWRFTAG